MTIEAPGRVEKKDREVGDSPCHPGAKLRWSEPCHAAYCEECDEWEGEPWVEPIAHGPTWQRGVDGKFIAPKYSLGPVIVAWVKKYVKGPDGSDHWTFTPEQLRMIYWIYAVDERGRWIYRELNIQRLKGWGKDPFAALLALIEMVGPCRPLIRDGSICLDKEGRVVGRREHAAWVVVAAVSKKQTRNTMLMFSTLVSKAMKRDYGVVVGKEQVVALSGESFIESVTSSPETMEGNRPTFQIGNEPHHWKENNRGHDMRSVMDRNLKMPGSRLLWITNAYNPSEMSVGQSNREAWEATQGSDATHVDTGVLYDSLEAPPDARIVPREIPVVLRAVRGDAHWFQVQATMDRMLDARSSVSESRRFYYNQIGADEEAWLDPQDIDATIHPQVRAWRKDPEIESDAIRLGWAPVAENEDIVVFFDGGKTDDHTVLSGCRVSDGYTFAIGFWGRPASLDAKTPWFAPRHEVDERFHEALTRFNVVAVWGDPSHAKDDEDDTPYWDGLLDGWHRELRDVIPKENWAVKSGDGQHVCKWDMTSPARQAQFVNDGAMAFVRDMEERTIVHDGHPMFVRYMKNAKGYMTRFGESLWKGARGSKRKIDGAVSHAGARMLRTVVLNRERTDTSSKQPGSLWW